MDVWFTFAYGFVQNIHLYLKKKTPNPNLVSAGSLTNVSCHNINLHAEGSVPTTLSSEEQQQSSVTSHGCTLHAVL